MKDYVLELVSSKTGFNNKLNCMREYLQAYILRHLYAEGVFRTTAFLGGTALRFLYDIPRYSEDLDFSLTGKESYSFINVIKKVKRELLLAGYVVSVSYNDRNIVRYAMIKFEGLMYEAGISPHPTQKFSIKVEIDTRPPGGAVLTTRIVNKYFPISFLAYDLPSLFAGKLHALLSRNYTKGRDFFDLGWYLSRWRNISPNFTLLKNALEQTGWEKEIPTPGNWREHLYKVVEETDWKKVREDVEPFLENPPDMDIFTKGNTLTLIKE